MLKDLKISGSGKKFTASVVVERAPDSGEEMKPETVKAVGGDIQTAVANLKMKAVANGKEQQQFDELAAAGILKAMNRTDLPKEPAPQGSQQMYVTGYRSEQLEKGLKTPDEDAVK
jgi:hypothetical protein